MISALAASANQTPPAGWEEGFLFHFWRSFIENDRYMLIVNGLWLTVQITLAAAVIGLVLGFISALMKISRFAPIRAISTIYIGVIRGTPMVVQLLIWWFIVFAPLGFDRTLTAMIAFGINSGAYVTEIFRAGILSIDKGQTEAGRSVGLTASQTMRLVILPQAIKNALPALCNEFISLFKETSIAGFIGLQELTRAGQNIQNRTFEAYVPLLSVAIIYLVIVLILTFGMTRLERRLRKSDSR